MEMLIFGNGEKLNFKTVFDTYFKALVLFAERYLWCQEESESVVQDTFMALLEKQRQFENALAVRAWLYTTVKNKALNVLKRRQLFNEYTAGREEEEEYFMETLIEEETRRLLFAAIDALPKQCRKICLLNLEGLDNLEIAEMLHISPNTVKFHKKNAYKFLRERLKDYFYCFLGLM